jgi:hypothetical protein
MQWIMWIALAMGALFALVDVFVLEAKRPGGEFVPGLFNFDQYKQSERSRHELFDKTPWR